MKPTPEHVDALNAKQKETKIPSTEIQKNKTSSIEEYQQGTESQTLNAQGCVYAGRILKGNTASIESFEAAIKKEINKLTKQYNALTNNNEPTSKINEILDKIVSWKKVLQDPVHFANVFIDDNPKTADEWTQKLINKISEACEKLDNTEQSDS